MLKAHIRDLYEKESPHLTGILKSRKFESNADKLIDELLSKRYEHDHILDILKMQSIDDSGLESIRNELA